MKQEFILLAGSDANARSLRELIIAGGYKCSMAGSQEEGFRLAQEGGIDVFLVEAEAADLQCCGALVGIKTLPLASRPRLILLTGGTPADRAGGLDLGANDVLSAPWDPSELLARLRVQLREKREIGVLEEQMRISEEGREVANTAFQALAVTEKMTRDAFSLGRVLKAGVSTLFVLALLVTGIFLLYSRRADKETRRTYSVIAQLERGLLTQEQLLREAQEARQELKQTDVVQQREQLQQQSDALRQKLLSAQNSDVSDLRKQLNETTSRLQRIEGQSVAAEGVIRSYAPSVCLLHISVAFLDKTSRRRLRYGSINPDGTPLKDSEGNVVYTLEGRAPEVRGDFFGTGFIVGDGKILTNHHVAQPWWKNDELSGAMQQGLEPVIAEMAAYFPGSTSKISLEVTQISEESDLALMHGDLSELKRPILKIDSRKEAAVSGQSLMSLGYAMGLSAILARADEDTVKNILKASGGDPTLVIDEVAKRNLIRPLVTQGHIGDVLSDRIVYDAQTTSGGSGGPLINHDGQVIGVTFAVVRDFGGSNFGVPIRFAQAMLNR
ncbi:MAG TPA: trypsin-like peptidase domain-containing protein [Candidatus Binatus sp.]|nr:trypsin-like peptidase domain-containing protein [Candidatus Binatus sp.]